jgi:phosphate transport system ATP-binding protein
LRADNVSAWFGDHLVLESVSLAFAPRSVTALIGPSGCGKSTFLRTLNRTHELVAGAAFGGSVYLESLGDIYSTSVRPTDVRRRVGMVFQKPNPFPAMSIAENVLAGPKLCAEPVDDPAALVRECLERAHLWSEVRDRLDKPGGMLSGGQQQRLCIARALAIAPRVLLMDEPCSALDPTSTRHVEDTITELAREITIVIVTHNMQQALRVSDQCAFFLAEANAPGVVVESGPTDEVFNRPRSQRTADYVHGVFG